jgi:hypothetical protein
VVVVIRLGETALHYAVRNSSRELVECLVKHSADTKIVALDGMSPFSMAQASGGDILELVSSGDDMRDDAEHRNWSLPASSMPRKSGDLQLMGSQRASVSSPVAPDLRDEHEEFSRLPGQTDNAPAISAQMAVKSNKRARTGTVSVFTRNSVGRRQQIPPVPNEQAPTPPAAAAASQTVAAVADSNNRLAVGGESKSRIRSMSPSPLPIFKVAPPSAPAPTTPPVPDEPAPVAQRRPPPIRSVSQRTAPLSVSEGSGGFIGGQRRSMAPVASLETINETLAEMRVVHSEDYVTITVDGNGMGNS